MKKTRKDKKKSMKKKGFIVSVISDLLAVLVFLLAVLLFILMAKIDLGVWSGWKGSPQQTKVAVLGERTADIMENDFLISIARTPVKHKGKNTDIAGLLNSIHEEKDRKEIEKKEIVLWKTVASLMDANIGSECYGLVIRLSSKNYRFGVAADNPSFEKYYTPSKLYLPARDASLIGLYLDLEKAGLESKSKCGIRDVDDIKTSNKKSYEEYIQEKRRSEAPVLPSAPGWSST